jgi:hypothetical protein
MCDWFDDPFYKEDNFKTDFDFNIDKHLKKFHDEINQNLKSSFDQIPKAIENNSSKKDLQKWTKEKPDIHYSSVTTSYRDGDLIHTKRKIYDNRKGNKYSETKQLGDRSITWHQETDKNGKCTESSTLKNVHENDINSFEIEFDKKITKNKNTSFKSLK